MMMSTRALEYGEEGTTATAAGTGEPVSVGGEQFFHVLGLALVGGADLVDVLLPSILCLECRYVYKHIILACRHTSVSSLANFQHRPRLSNFLAS